MGQRFSKDFDPILLEGHTATLFGAGLPEDGQGVRCLAVGQLPEYVKDFGALTAATWLQNQSDTNLIMPTMTLAVFRMKIITAMKMRLNNPSAVKQWRSRDQQFYLPQFPENGSELEQAHVWRMSEFMVWQDESYPTFELYSTAAQLASYVLFSGWRYSLAKLQGTAKGQISIWVNDWPSIRNK